MLPMRAEDRRIISCWRLAVALPHSAISPTVRPQPVQTLALASSLQISLHGDGGRSVMFRVKHAPDRFCKSANPYFDNYQNNSLFLTYRVYVLLILWFILCNCYSVIARTLLLYNYNVKFSAYLRCRNLCLLLKFEMIINIFQNFHFQWNFNAEYFILQNFVCVFWITIPKLVVNRETAFTTLNFLFHSVCFFEEM